MTSSEQQWVRRTNLGMVLWLVAQTVGVVFFLGMTWMQIRINTATIAELRAQDYREMMAVVDATRSMLMEHMRQTIPNGSK